jgi:uncharacterized protein
MLEIVEKLLVLQDCDRRIARLGEELARIEPERQTIRTKAAAAQTAVQTSKQRVKELETERKELELEVESKKREIERYSLQQFDTRRNEEYRALQHEIDACKQAIVKLEDQELELMEQVELLQKEIGTAAQAAAQTDKIAEKDVAVLGEREANLKKDLAELEARREALASGVDEGTRARYERLFKFKGDNVVVGVQHGVCGGCHMRLPPQMMVHCQAQQEIVMCPNCGRILYYSRDMDLVVAE